MMTIANLSSEDFCAADDPVDEADGAVFDDSRSRTARLAFKAIERKSTLSSKGKRRHRASPV